jgi:putative transcriptional regulator
MNLALGKILVSHPNLDSGIFSKSVILLTEHHNAGSVGFILNKPCNIDLGKLMSDRGIAWHSGDALYTGGPLNTSSLVMIHTDDFNSQSTMHLPGGFAVSGDELMIEKIVMGNRPNAFRFFTGVCSWAPGQLMNEIQHNKSWLTATPNDAMLFNSTGLKQWRRALNLVASETTAQYF